MLMFEGHLQVLFNGIPPNSQVLFSESGNAPLFWGFWIIQDVLRIWFCGGPFHKKYPNFDFWLSSSRDPGVPLEPLGCIGSKSCIKQTVTGARFYGGGVPFIKMLKFQNFYWPPASPAFRPRFLEPWAKYQNSAPKVLFASLSQFRKCATWPPCPKTPGGDRFGRNPLFRGQGLTPRALGSESPALKLLARSLAGPVNLAAIPWTSLCVSATKSNNFIDSQTDWQTHICLMPSLP